MTPALSRELDFWLDIRQLADERLRELDRAIAPEMRLDQVHDCSTAVKPPPCLKPRRPVAGNAITENSMSNQSDLSNQNTASETEERPDIDVISDEVRELRDIVQSRWLRQVREWTVGIFDAIEDSHPAVRDAIHHEALDLAVDRLADAHGGIYVQGRVAAILDAKFNE